MHSDTRAMRTEVQGEGQGLINHLCAWDTRAGMKLSQAREEPTAPPQGLLLPVPLGPSVLLAVHFTSDHSLSGFWIALSN